MEVLKICSFYINKAEPLLDNDLRNTYPAIDRLRILQEVFDLETKFQEQKLDLILAYLECLEHTSDILEQQRLIQAIVDEMARRPRLNMSGSHFKDSYNCEIECLTLKTQLVREIIRMVMRDEFKANNSVREYIEKSHRLLYEQMKKEFKVYDAEEVEDQLNMREVMQKGGKNSGLRDKKNDKLIDGETGNPKKKKFDEVEAEIRNNKARELARLIPSYNYADAKEFAKALSIPYKNLEAIMKDHHERDPLVKQSLHEHVNFIRNSEGYPYYIIQNAVKAPKFQFSS